MLIKILYIHRIIFTGLMWSYFMKDLTQLSTHLPKYVFNIPFREKNSACCSLVKNLKFVLSAKSMACEQRDM